LCEDSMLYERALDTFLRFSRKKKVKKADFLENMGFSNRKKL
jgi:hypothetical protein